MKKHILIIFLMLTTLCYSQDKLKNVVNDSIVFDSSKYKRVYKFTVGYLPLSVYLIESLDGNKEGFVNLNLYKWQPFENFQGRININNLTVENIFLDLDAAKFELLEIPKENEPCSIVLDGDYTVYEIFTENLNKEIYYSLSTNSTNIEECESNKKAQNVLNILNDKIHFREMYVKLKSLLPTGKYSYVTGIYICQLSID